MLSPTFPHRCKHPGMTLIEVMLSIAVLAALFITVASKFDIGDIFCKQTVSAADCTAAGGVSISAITEGGKYLVEIPVDGDFSGPLTLMTGYLIQLVQEGRVRITAATNTGVIFTY